MAQTTGVALRTPPFVGAGVSRYGTGQAERTKDREHKPEERKEAAGEGSACQGKRTCRKEKGPCRCCSVADPQKKTSEPVSGRGELTSETEKGEILSFVIEAKSLGVAEKSTCGFLGITVRTIQNWRSKGLRDKRKGSSHPTSRLALTPAEWDALFEAATCRRFADHTPEQIVATLAQESVYIASTSSMYRVLRKRNAMAHRSESRKASATRESTEIIVTGPNQVWAWDITWLKTPVRGIFLYAYTVIDLFDRSIVGWCIETYESDELSMLLFARITRDMKVVPAIVMADNGHPMRGMTLAVFLDSLFISRSYSRPRCSVTIKPNTPYHNTN